MKRSASAILTTHAGSLARSQDLHEMLLARGTGKLIDDRFFDDAVRNGVMDVVKRQVDTGLTTVSDGEQSKINYAAYVKDRLAGIASDHQPMPFNPDAKQFPEWASKDPSMLPWGRQAVTGPLTWKNFGDVERDIVNMKAATQAVPPQEAFMCSVSPAAIAAQVRNA